MALFSRVLISYTHRVSIAIALLCAVFGMALSQAAFAQSVPPTPHVSRVVPRLALDIERLRAVAVGRLPNDVPTCQVLVVGGGLGGVAAAEDLAGLGISCILTEPTGHLGGQFTSQGVSVPDENRFIEQEQGPGTRHYRELREQVRAAYAQMPGIKAGRDANVGQCWASRVSGEPSVWEAAMRARLAPLAGPRGLRAVLTRTQLIGVHRYPGNGQISAVDVVNLDTRRITRIGAQFVLDATETGDVLPLAGSPWTVGQEAQATYGEPDAPPQAHPEWVQSFTYSFDLRWTPQGPQPIVPRPPGYDTFLAQGEYTLAYDYSDNRGRVQYQIFTKAPDAAGPFWTYRRLVAASSFADNPAYAQDIALVNWRGNDYRDASFIGKPVPEQVRILTQAKAFAQGFLFWLQTQCPRDNGGQGCPEFQPAGDILGTDGFAPAPYVRESRRLLSQTVLTENDLLPDPARPDPRLGTPFFDSVGTALYAIDIHPARGEPPHLAAALPYSLPLGAFVPRSGPENIIPAAKDFGASRLASASARMHPTEWEAGEIAGNLAAFCLEHGVSPADIRQTPALLAAFQARLETGGITTRWPGITTRWRDISPALTAFRPR